MKLVSHFLVIFIYLWLRLCDCFQEGPVFVQEPPARVFFPNSKGVTLSCAVEGRPVPTVTWITPEGSGVLPIEGVRQLNNVEGNSSLKLLPFGPDQYRQDIHVTTYRCRASNPVGSIVSRPIAVQAVVLQHFEIGISATRAQVGGSVLFTCDVPPTVERHVRVTHWSLDGRVVRPSLHPEERFWAIPSGHLVVRNVVATDAFTHVTCTAVHEFDQQPRTSGIARLIISGDKMLSHPQLLLRREWVRNEEGKDLVLPCVADGHPEPVVRWYKDDPTQGGRLLITGNLGGRLVRIVTGQLIFSPLRPEDAGLYVCIANNSAGSDSYRVELSVKRPLRVVAKPPVQRVDLNQPATITCEIEGYPEPSIAWFKDAKPLSQLPLVTSYGKILHISRVSRDDGGMYQCFVRSEEDAAQGTAQINLGDSVPTIEYRFISQTLQQGHSVGLKCVAFGSPLPRFSWTLDGFPLPQNERIVMGQYTSVGGNVVSHVNISDVRSEDGGIYTCSADSRAGSSKHSARLNIYGPVYVRPMPLVNAVAGESLFLSCPASGYPLAKLIWEKEGRLLPQTARQIVHENGTLVIREVQKDADGGQYTCTAEDKQKRTHSSTATVRVLVPPKMSTFSFREDLMLGDRVSVQCSVNRGDAPLTVLWLKEGSGVRSEGDVTTRQLDPFTSLLSIEHLSSAHAGNYTCIVSNDAATVSHSATLRVNVPPVINPFYFGDATSGERIQVVCSIRKGDPPFSVSWLKDGLPLELGPTEGVEVRPLDLFTTSLLLERADERHSGNYSCLATNQAKTTSHSDSLTVKVPPSWVIFPNDTSSVLGQNVEIACQAKGFPTPKIAWRKSIGSQSSQYTPILSMGELGLSLSPTGGSGSAVAPNGSLILRSVSHQDEGQYLCEATNGVGGGLSSLIRLSVHSPPRFEKQFNQEVAVRKGSPVTLECQVRGDPPLRMEWRKAIHSLLDASAIREVAGGLKGELMIASATAKDSGSYTCLAENEYGTDTYHISLVVQDVPAAPYGLRLDQKGSRHVSISWILPRQLEAGPVDTYVVQYKKAEAATWDIAEDIEGRIVGKEDPIVQLRNLIPSTSYLLRVLAKNHLGLSLPSEALQVATKGEPPSGPPVGVGAEPLTSRSIRVSWSPPIVNSHHGPLLGYNVGLKNQRLNGNDSYNFTTVSANAGEEIIGNLRPWTHYAVSVRAYNSEGPGPLSHSVIVRTLQDVPSEAPLDMQCTSGATPTSLMITWNPSPPDSLNGILQGYKLTLTLISRDDDFVNETIRRTEATSELVTDLRPWTNYSVSVASVTREGPGVPSSEIICATREGIPGSPRLLALQSAEDAVLLSWIPPDPPTGVITGYTLYHISPLSHSTQQYPLPGYATSYVAKRVSLGPHQFWLKARTKSGEGKSSDVSKIILNSKVPVGIASWSRRVVALEAEDVHLECRVVSHEPVSPSWTKNGESIINDHRYSVREDDSLVIKRVQKVDEGNFSCSVDVRSTQNINLVRGHTSVTHTVLVQVAPSAPDIHVLETTSSSISLKWTAGDSGGATVRSWHVWWRQVSDSGTWKTKSLGRTLSKHIITDLNCGSEYQVYMTAKTKVGVSPPSAPVTVRTRGGVPKPPPTHQIASVNSSYIRVWMERWADGGCPITHFTLEIRHNSEPSWTTLASNLAPQDVYDFSHRGDSELGLRLTAFNIAGGTTATVHVLGPAGARVVESRPPDSAVSSVFLKDPRMLVSAAASALALVLTVSAFVLCIRRRALSEAESSKERESNTPDEVETSSNLLKQRDMKYPTIGKQYSPSGLDIIPEYSEEIYPYATFQLPDEYQTNEMATPLQTFVYQDSKYGITEEHPPPSASGNRHGEYAKVGVVRGPPGRRAIRGQRSRKAKRSESEEYDSDSDTDVVSSSRTESSNQLDCATLTADNRLLQLDSRRTIPFHLEGVQDDGELQAMNCHLNLIPNKNVHHNLIYHTNESSCTSTDASPVLGHHHQFFRHLDVRHCDVEEASLTFPHKRELMDSFVIKKSKHKPVKNSTPQNFEEGKTDQKRSSKPKPAGFTGQITSHFRAYTANKPRKDFSIIKV